MILIADTNTFAIPFTLSGDSAQLAIARPNPIRKPRRILMSRRTVFNIPVISAFHEEKDAQRPE